MTVGGYVPDVCLTVLVGMFLMCVCVGGYVLDV